MCDVYIFEHEKPFTQCLQENIFFFEKIYLCIRNSLSVRK